MLGFMAAMCGAIAVSLGAFGAHGLKDRLSSEALQGWQSATFYLLLHAVAALSIGVSQRAGLSQAGGWCLLGGAALFAASLYAMALGGPRILGVVTPLGGITMIAGWALLGIAFLRASPW